MDIHVEHSGGITIVEMLGELDSVTAPSVQEQILPLAQKGSRVLLDMSAVAYMSSAGLRMLLLLYRRINDNAGKVVIAGLNDSVRDIMSITGFLDYFVTVQTRHEGLQALA